LSSEVNEARENSVTHEATLKEKARELEQLRLEKDREVKSPLSPINVDKCS